MSNFRYEKEDLDRAVEALKAGGIILTATDTVWGLACDSGNPEAVRKLGELKERPEGPFVVLVENDARLNKHVDEVPAVAWDIIDLSDNPVTIVYSGACNMAAQIIAADGSAGIRMVKEPFIRDLIRKIGRPLVSTSANFHGKPTPAIYDEIDPELMKRVDYVSHYRRSDRSRSKPSSIIKLGLGGEVKVIRP